MNKDKRARLYQARRILSAIAIDLERASSSVVGKVAEEEREALDNLRDGRGFGGLWRKSGGLQWTRLAASLENAAEDLEAADGKIYEAIEALRGANSYLDSCSAVRLRRGRGTRATNICAIDAALSSAV